MSKLKPIKVEKKSLTIGLSAVRLPLEVRKSVPISFEIRTILLIHTAFARYFLCFVMLDRTDMSRKNAYLLVNQQQEREVQNLVRKSS